MGSKFSKPNVRRWMRTNASNHVDACGEVDFTSLTTAAASAFNVDDVGGPLDDSEHWIWELALDVRLDSIPRRGQ